MGIVDEIYLDWINQIFGDKKFSELPEWPIRKNMFAEYLLQTKTKQQIWKMLCGKATGPCTKCKCMCAAGMAWNELLRREQALQEITEPLSSGRY